MAIKINLLPREAAPARAGIGISVPKLVVGGGRATQIATGVLVLLILGLGVMAYLARSSATAHQTQIDRLSAESAALKTKLTELNVVEAAKRDIQRRLEIIGRVAKSQGVPVAMMNGVLRAVPQGIWLTSFEMKPQEVRVRVEAGRGTTATAASETLAKLEAKRQEAGTAPSPAAGRGEAREVVQIQGYTVIIKGTAFNNFQVADFMDNLRKVGVFADVDFVVTQATRVEQTRVMNFEVTATVKL